MSFSLTVFVASSCPAETKSDWEVDRDYRVTIQVAPNEETSRKGDLGVAVAHLDFRILSGIEHCDLSSLVLVPFPKKSIEGLEKEQDWETTATITIPFRFYDDSIPWRFPDKQGYAHSTSGAATPVCNLEGGVRCFNVIGEGRSGRLAWCCPDEPDEVSFFHLYFNPLKPGGHQSFPSAGFVGDGSYRCLSETSSFGPVIHGRVAVADWNGDRLFDLLLGNGAGTVFYYENNGSPGKPVFQTPRLLFTQDGIPLDVGWSSAPYAVDWDNDGDLDLIVGAEKESFVFFSN